MKLYRLNNRKRQEILDRLERYGPREQAQHVEGRGPKPVKLDAYRVGH